MSDLSNVHDNPMCASQICHIGDIAYIVCAKAWCLAFVLQLSGMICNNGLKKMNCQL